MNFEIGTTNTVEDNTDILAMLILTSTPLFKKLQQILQNIGVVCRFAKHDSHLF